MWTNRAIKFASHNPLFFHTLLQSMSINHQPAGLFTHPALGGRRLKHPRLMIIIMLHLFNSSCYSFIAPVHLHQWCPYVTQFFCLVFSAVAWATAMFLVFAKATRPIFLEVKWRLLLSIISVKTGKIILPSKLKVNWLHQRQKKGSDVL